MLISAIICSHNGSRYIKKSIDSLLKQTLPQNQYDILIVDNHSIDSTRQIIHSYRDVKNLRYLFEPKVGLSHARNAGWRFSQAKYIAFLDDDAVADPKWLENIIKAFEKISPEPGCVGGIINPIWESERPEWLPDNLLSHLTLVNWGNAPMIMNEKKWIAAASIAYSRRALEVVGGFSTSIGLKGKNLSSMEDVDLRTRMENNGFISFYDPSIIANHYIPHERLQRAWFLKRSFWQGVSEGYLHVRNKKMNGLKRWMVCARTMGRLVLKPSAWKTLFQMEPSHQRLTFKCSVYARLGYVLYLLGIIFLK